MNGTRTPKDALILFKKRAATTFEEAYPLGNGHLGAMVYGGAMQEELGRNFGITAGIAEMPVQSTPDEVHILPALPSEWREISARGLCAMGKRRIHLKVRNGRLAACEIVGTPPAKILVGGEDMTATFLRQGAKCVLKP